MMILSEKIMERHFDFHESIVLLIGELEESLMLLQKIQVLMKKKEKSYELV
jgi:hypothetical protein